MRPGVASSSWRRSTPAGQLDPPRLVTERIHPEPLVQLRVVEILDAELEHLPERAPVALIDVDVAQRDRQPQEASGRQQRSDDTDPPVVHAPALVPLQDLGPHETGGLEPLVQKVEIEEPRDLRAGMVGHARPLVSQRIERVVVDQIREPDRILRASSRSVLAVGGVYKWEEPMVRLIILWK